MSGMSISGRRSAVGIVLAWLLCGAALAGPEESIGKGVHIVHKPGLVSIGLADFDLLTARFKALKGAFVFADAKGAPIASYEVDYTLPVARSHVVFRKKEGAAYASVRIRLADGEATVFEKRLDLPPAAETARLAAVLDRNAVVLPGASKEPVPAAMRSLRVPDYGSAPAAPLAKADRVVAAADTVKRVRCDLNYPVAISNNNSFIGRRTAHPDDLSRMSLYISLRSTLMNPETAALERESKYLLEMMMDKEWLLPALGAEGDVSVMAPPTHLRIQATDTTTQSRHLGTVRLTGDDAGGLMQIKNSVCEDDRGNLYFSVPYRGCVRFNIRTRDWEPMPVDFGAGAGPKHDQYVDFMERLLPRMEDVPYSRELVKARRMDTFAHAYYHDGRIYLSFARDAIFDVPSGRSVFFATVMSIPTGHWDDAKTFEKEVKLLAASWPTASHPLWDTWVQPEEMDRKLLEMRGLGNRLYLLSYHRNYFWTLDLDGEGNTSRLTRYEAFGGKRIGLFEYPNVLVDRAGKPLGLSVGVTLKGETEKRTAFLPMDAHALTAEIPPHAASQPGHYRDNTPIRGETQYGRTTFSKGWLAGRLGWPREGIRDGEVTIYYDAIAAMRAEPERHRFILDRIGRYSLAPSYHVTAAPGQPDLAIGIGEYGYFQAEYDTSKAADGYVVKRYMPLDTGEVKSSLAVAAGLGPYAHLWRRDGDSLYLYYVGYHEGISRMLYSVGGKPLERFRMESLAPRLVLKTVDAPGPPLKWFASLNPGLDGKMVFTGTHDANRGGDAYCGGLLYFDTKKLDARYRLSEMSRAYNTGQIAWRVVLGEAGGASQEIYLGGRHNPVYARMLPEDRRPPAPQDKFFVYEDRPPAGVTDRYAFTFGPEAVSRQDHEFAPDQVHLLLLADDGRRQYLASLDPEAGAFADVRALPNGTIGFARPGARLLPTPDGRIMLYAFDDAEGTSATFTEVRVAADGRLSFVPHLTLTAAERGLLTGGVVMTFIPDLVRKDGSCDLLLGCATGPEATTSLRLIEDFILPRE